MSVTSLRSQLRLIADGAEWHARIFAADTEPDQETLADAITDFMGVYCQTAAILTADWYNAIDRESTFFARPMSVVPPKRAEDTAAWVFKRGDTAIERRLAAAAYSMVFDAARDTVAANASDEGVAVARVEEEGACDDCKKLATRVPKARNSSSDDVSWERHQRCEFLFEPVRGGIWVPPEYARQWLTVAQGVAAH